MMRCLIAEDEAPARQRLKRLLADVEDVSVVGEAADGVSALEQVSALQPDLLLLDIQMPELDGLAVASALVESGPAIIFVTAYDEHALRAFELSAIDYLVKPVSRERLAAALGKARQMRGGSSAFAPALEALAQRLEAARPRRMAVRCGAKYVVFDPATVFGIVSKDHYSALLLDHHELLADEPLEQLARRFDPSQFVRVHRSAVINLACLRELVHEGDRRYVAVLTDRSATRVAVSRERLPALKAALGLE
jgi:two-component system, LytTR family, response regulator